MARDARHIDEGQRQLPLICLSCIPSRGIGSTAPHWHVPARKQENAGVGGGVGTHLELVGRQLADVDGFDVS